ncbi:dynamin family protein [Paenibacillus cellulositrophicus]|uniref:dynamin family protein n=1 Tax=Paenibacillus cellulositrophicus TaxID=562959 RepID=UPI003F7D01BB
MSFTVHTTASQGSIALQPLKEQLAAWGDARSASLIDDLIHKADAGEMTIAFCGHFSAGKSSLINSLCGRKVLPSGPVPTSANVVSIRNGEPRALIYPAAGAGVEAPRETADPLQVSLKELYEYCTNGGDYSSVEVWDHVPLLGEHGVFMDTPGVDSTDDGHQKATHSALHLADVVLYVMDYNHVQSENNLVFAKSLSDWGKPLYLIVNQIDKHRERELSFDTYRQEVEAAFKRWQVHYENLLFISLKNPEHPYNQRAQLDGLVQELIAQRGPLLSYSIDCSARHIAEQHTAQFADSLQEDMEQLLQEMGGAEKAAELEREMGVLKEEIDRFENIRQLQREAVRREAEGLLENANLTPADLRDRAQLFLESRKPGFKKGFLFAGAKTEQEKQERLEGFLSSLREQCASQIGWHLQELLRRWGQSHRIWNEERDQQLADRMPVIGPELLEGTVEPGAVLSGEYLLNYCRKLSAEIKALYRRAALDAAEEMLADVEASAAPAKQRAQQELAALQEQTAAMARYTELAAAIAARKEAAARLLPPQQALTPGILPRVSAPTRPAAQPAGEDAGAPMAAPAVKPAPHGGAGPQGGAAKGRRQRLDAAAAQLREAAALLGRHPALASAARGLESRAEALAGGSFTMALFGAFSAGKSSFANALLGDSVLPVSPHPTTAAINRILAPEGEYAHGTARVQMKSAEAFQDDLAYSFSILQLSKPEGDGWLEAVRSMKPEGVHPAGLPHYGFLKAAAAGWDLAKPLLGSVRTVDMTEYRSFVADETKSCFVDRIDLYYSSPLTEQGIVLVDTPGADSLHARHTGVTFQYMKQADAIVFVTYYNHAFSKGDRQFLTQLGRVKDSFALDKMFFIVNAADLAASQEELEQVVKHVDGNLKARGIRLPHIYPLSSMTALEAKLGGDEAMLAQSGLGAFEDALGVFAGEELPKLSLQAAASEVSAARKRAEEWARLSRQDAGSRQRRKQELVRTAEQAKGLVGQFATMQQGNLIAQETKELLFHVRQRIGFGMGDFFNETFHPSVLREDAGQLKRVFAGCGRELERTLVRELEQELLATTLRLENKGKQIVHAAAVQTTEDISALDAGLVLNPPEEKEWETPELKEVQLEGIVDWNAAWGYFKSPKAFFEGGGREKMRAAVEEQIKEALSREVSAQEGLLSDFYAQRMGDAQHRQAGVLQEQLKETVEALTASLEQGERPETWDTLAAELLHIEIRMTS